MAAADDAPAPCPAGVLVLPLPVLGPEAAVTLGVVVVTLAPAHACAWARGVEGKQGAGVCAASALDLLAERGWAPDM